MAYTKEKMDVVIDNVTYKNIDVTVSTNWEKIKEYDISTTGIAQIIKQFVKNNYGDIKVWAKSSKFSMGSSVSIYLWKVPDEWKRKITDFADRFGMYNDRSGANGGDGYWNGAQVGATTIDGEKVGNYSPYMSVTNHAPYDSKEYDMTPPNYDEKPTPKKKEYERKGGKYSPTDNLDLVLDCGNGWKIYVGKPKEKYLYNVVKDKDTKQNKEQWAEIKADMLEAGFMWGYKSGTFQRWTTMPDDTIPQKACDVLSKYWGGASQPKEETPKEPQIIPQGTSFELIEADSIFTKGETGVLAEDFYEGNTYVEAYMNSESRPDYPHFIRFAKIKVIEEAPREEIPEKDALPFYVNESVVSNANIEFENKYYSIGTKGNIVSLNYDKKEASVYFENNGVTVPNIPFKYIDKYVTKEETPEEEILPFVKGETIKLKMPFTYNNSTYPQGLRGEIKSIDYVFKTAYVYFYGDESGNYPVPFEYLEKFVDTYETPKEVNLDEYINDLNVLLEMDDNESRRIELATYISDLNTLKLLQ